MILQLPADLQRAQYRRFWTVSKDECATVASRQAQEFAFRFSGAELLGTAHNLFERLKLVALLVNQQLGITDNVDEQDMADVKFHFRRRFGRHGVHFVCYWQSFWKRGSPRSGSKS